MENKHIVYMMVGWVLEEHIGSENAEETWVIVSPDVILETQYIMSGHLREPPEMGHSYQQFGRGLLRSNDGLGCNFYVSNHACSHTSYRQGRWVRVTVVFCDTPIELCIARNQQQSWACTRNQLSNAGNYNHQQKPKALIR